MKQIIFTPQAPAPIGPYSQAVRAGNVLYVSGQVALDATHGTMVQTDITAETHQVMCNLQAVLQAAQTGFENIIKTTIFLTDLNDFSAVNEVYASYFTHDYPARETVQVSRLPRNANVEISVMALCTTEL
jgi:2-iminobutanoate/2-iminopropanoate deaminase